MQLMRKAKEDIEQTEFEETHTQEGSQEPSTQRHEFSMKYDEEEEEEENIDEIERWRREKNKNLDDFPSIRKIYVKFNTSLGSQASVERIFSFARLIIGLRRGHLDDENFEKQLVCKANRKLNPKLFVKRSK